MRQVQAHAEDVNLDQERRRTYLGTARVRFEALHFGRRLRVPDEKHVEYLEGCFRTSGCRPLEKQNHISAKVSQEVLGEAIQASGIGHGDLLSNQTPGYVELEMPPGRQIECLHGQHRILAASRVLGPHDKWWAVDLYRSGTSHTTRGFTIQLTYAADLHPDLETWLTGWGGVPQDSSVRRGAAAQPPSEVDGPAQGQAAVQPQRARQEC